MSQQDYIIVIYIVELYIYIVSNISNNLQIQRNLKF